MKFDKSNKILDDLINAQRSFIKTSLGFDENQNKIAKSSRIVDLPKNMDEVNPKSYVETLKKEENKKEKNEKEYEVL